MQYSNWHRYDYSPGRYFNNHKNVYVKYDDKEKIKDRICEILNEIIRIEAAARFTTDTHLSDSERLIIAIPMVIETQKMIRNYSDILYHAYLGYYFNAEPKTHHFGISNVALEGHLSSFVIREIEKIFTMVANRDDMAGRIVRNVAYEQVSIKSPGDNYMRSTIIEGLDITLGYRMVIYGKKVNSGSLFIPVPDGADVIEQMYYNIEQILHQNFSTYDELNERDYLKVTDTLIFKELVGLMKRAKLKENLRKKILNNIKHPTYFTSDPAQLYGEFIGDLVYDTVNNVDDQIVREASDRSRELFNSFMIRATEITSASNVNPDGVKLENAGSTYVPEKMETVQDILKEAKAESKETVKAGASSPAPKAAPKAPEPKAPQSSNDDLMEI